MTSSTIDQIAFALQKVVERKNLTASEASSVMEVIMSGLATPAKLSAFLIALRMKGETAEEIAGFASTMRAVGTKVHSKREPLVDTCGTGGDGAGTFNISTAAAIVTAAAGVPVAKHGNRAVSSRSGSADVLEALGVRLEKDPAVVGRILDEIGITFLFAQRLHPAMRHAIEVRKELATRTVFNILGPLTNPAGAGAQVLGVFAPHLTDIIADVLILLGTRRAFVVHGLDGLDEISVSGQTRISEVKDGVRSTYAFTPEDAGVSRHGHDSVRGGTAAENAEIIRQVFTGSKGGARDVVLLNAAAAIVAGEKASTMKEGVERARAAVDDGKALQLLTRWVEASKDLG